MYVFLDRLLTTLFNNNTKKLLDNLSNESSTNSSGFHSKSEYSPKLDETVHFTYSGNDKSMKIFYYYLFVFFLGLSPLYTNQDQ